MSEIKDYKLLIKAFRAVDDIPQSMRYADGHINVLNSIGVLKVTSANLSWMEDPAVFVVLVEDMNTGEVLGGARVNLTGGAQLLPIEMALFRKDPRIIHMVEASAGNGGTGELCGLWNSRKVAGIGLGSVFVTRACIAILSQLHITTLYGFAASYTLDMSVNLGYEVLKNVGTDGSFFYPKENLLAYALRINDVINLPTANEEERNHVMKLREDFQQVKIENTIRGELELKYDLTLKKNNKFVK